MKKAPYTDRKLTSEEQAIALLFHKNDYFEILGWCESESYKKNDLCKEKTARWKP